MEYAAIAAIVASVVGALVGAGQDAQAAKVRQEALDMYGPELLPQLEKAEAEQLDGTAFGQLQEDGSLRSRQLQTLAQLEDVVANEGTTEADRAANELAFNDAAGATESASRGIENSMRQRGQSGGPGDYALQLQAQQGATNQAANMARANASDARMRALRAMESGGDLAGDVRGQDYQRLSDVAQAQDAANQFNNVQRTAANAYNLSLPQQNFDNVMLMNNAKANAANGVAAGYERGGQAARETAGGVSQGFITLGTKKKKGDES